MSYIPLPRVALLVGTALTLAAGPAGAAELSCPGELEIQEIPGGGPPWIVSPGRRSAVLAGVSIVNGQPGEERADAPVILVPDDESSEGHRVTQTWHLAAYRR